MIFNMRTLTVGFCMVCLAVAGREVAAQSGGGFELTWGSVDTGGNIATGGQFKLASVMGQPDPGPAMAGGNFSLTGGFLQDSSYFPVPVTVSRFTLD